jgi:hypothetical protein
MLLAGLACLARLGSEVSDQLAGDGRRVTGQSYGAPQHASTSRDQWVCRSQAREAQQCDPSNVERGPIGSRSALRALGNSLVQAAKVPLAWALEALQRGGGTSLSPSAPRC